MAIYKNKEELLATDWQAKINQAAELGDWQMAAQYEQARNEKIASPEYTGRQTPTYRYTRYLPEKTAPAAAVTGGVTGVPDAVQSGALPSFDDSALQAAKPSWSGHDADRIEALLEELEDRDAFHYDPESDPLYRRYRAQYRREGARAMEDTLAEAASHAGGMNSYAVTAAQQAGDYYNARLMEQIPELAQLAYEMYLEDYERDLDRLDRLQDREEEAYSRYQDDLAEWYAQLDAAYQRHRDSVADTKWQQTQDAKVQKQPAEDTPAAPAAPNIEDSAAAQLRADGYTEEEISGLLSESVWNHQRENYLRTGGGAVEVTAYPTYEEYVKAYIRYLSEQ